MQLGRFSCRTLIAPLAAGLALAVVTGPPAHAANVAPPHSRTSVAKHVVPPSPAPIKRRAAVRRLKGLGPGWSAAGSCDGYAGSWYFTGQLNSNLAGGDTYYTRFWVHQDGVGYVQDTGWSAGIAVRTAPGWTWVTRTLNIPRRKWVTVYMQIWSYRHGGVIDGEWLPMTSYTLAEISGNYCRTMA